MKALVFHGPGQTAWQDVPDPSIKDAADAIVRVNAVTICGTDLHIIKGDVPEVTPGRVWGHEAVGTAVETGSDVRTFRPGDRVLISCISSCGRCRFCREGHYGQCRGGGGRVLGHTIDGTQTEYVRVPFADLSMHPLPSAVDSHDAVLLADIFPTSYEVGITTGLVDTHSTPMLLRMMAAGRHHASALVTHRFERGQMKEAYDVFARAGDTGALKVVLGSPRHDVVAEAAQREVERT
ncbi:alcohol dehydrogenase catalytic domain-containing protein [Streptomyces lavendulae]|uniref:alcohol dehydrogenase catalytic domain-containing protein n=1 Tax=Streptomyces lavendulae TaxID=1914 RepID=UPI0033EE79AD